MGKKVMKTLAALILAGALLASSASGAVPALAAGTKQLQIGVISDLHTLPEGAAPDHRGEVLESALAAMAAHAKQNGLKYVLVPGDVTRDGGLSGHKYNAARLERFEKETGIQVAVVPGNHDINNDGDGERTTPEQFREIYKNLGFDLPNASYYRPPAGKKGGMLSYAADLGDGFRLIAMDVCKYPADQNPKGTDSYHTGGMISETMMDWILKECAAAQRAGKTVIGMMHHSLAPHTGPQEYILLDFMLDDWLRVRETLADAGMHFVITGHMHIDEIGYGVSDSGEVIYDICTASLAEFPCKFREIKFTAKGAKDITADVKSYEADCVKPVADGRGGVYSSPFSVHAYAMGYGGNGEGIQGFLTDVLGGMLGSMLNDMGAGGGIASMLDGMLDLEGMLGGLSFIEKNIMGLLNDIFRQIDKLYLSDSARTLGLIDDVVDKLLGMQVSQYPSTRFNVPFGMGDKNRPGTLGDLINEGVLYCYGRFTGVDQNKFVTDALYGFEYGDTMEKLFSLLLDIVLHDLLEDEFLPNLRLNLSPVFVRPVVRLTLGSLLDGFLRLLLLGDNSFQALVDLVFNVNNLLNLMPYSGIDDAVDSLLADFWTPSQDEALGWQIAYLARRFFYPQNELPDFDAVLRYSGPRRVTPTQEDFRLPSMLSQMLPADGAENSRVISWFTKDSVKGTDIRVWNKNGDEITKGLKITKSAEAAEREFPGVDLGIMGMLEVPVHLTRHTVSIAGLEPGRTYSYQVGDAAKGWWSPVGAIRTAMDPDYQYTQFLSIADPQAQAPRQYERSWGSLSAKALALYPAARFIVSAGDNVDGALNLHHWQWFLDSGRDALLRLPLMTAAGNHEGSGDFALQQYLPFGQLKLPQAQDCGDGVYYSFDYNNIHFIMLNTNDLDGSALSAAQVEWLREDVRASDADWNIIVMHKSMYSDGSHYKDADVIGLREQLSALFPLLGIDLVISGHDHTYLRTEVQGVKYVIAGTSGVKYYNVTDPLETDKYFPRAQALADAKAPVFAAYTASGNELLYEAWLMDEKGELKKIDEFSIVKPEIEVIPLSAWDFPEDDGLPARNPKTGDSTAVVLISLSLMLAAGLAMWMMRKRELEMA